MLYCSYEVIEMFVKVNFWNGQKSIYNEVLSVKNDEGVMTVTCKNSSHTFGSLGVKSIEVDEKDKIGDLDEV